MVIPRLSRSDRQDQILDDVLEVVLELGISVTSRDLAAAAGVSEGTLFKVFETKENLLRSLASKHSGMPDSVGVWLQSIDVASMSFEDLVIGIIENAMEQYRRSFRIFYALGPYIDSPGKDALEQFERELEPWTDALLQHSHRLRASPESAASILRMHAVAAADTTNMWTQQLTPAEHADIFLHGLMRPHDAAALDSTAHDSAAHDSTQGTQE
ncbi:TetR/AcrR family transcriptional regulator [Agrococcus casei]|uniref:TetR/AcrR family transcriptional regulator n=2 Tax=Agrococcus casei TaxID=343512 RepID=UPI003F8F8C39